MVKHLIPVHISGSATGPKRSKRALFDFIGTLAKSLFGTATETDIEQVGRHVQHIESETTSMGENLRKINEHLSSFIKMSDARIANAISGIQNNHHILATLAHKTDITQYLMLILANTIAVSDNYSRLELASEEWILGAQTLLNGFLPFQLVPPRKLKEILDDLSTSLSSSYPGWKISHMDPGFYYTVRDITFTKSDTYLYVSIKIPMSSISSFYDLYTLIALNVQLPFSQAFYAHASAVHTSNQGLNGGEVRVV